MSTSDPVPEIMTSPVAVGGGETLGVLDQSSLSGRVVRNSLWHASGWFLLMALNIVSIPVIIRSMGAAAYGIVVLVMSVSAPMGLLDMGMTDATVKFLAESFGRGDRQAAQRYAASSMLFNLVVGGLGAILLVAFAPLLVNRVFEIPENSREAATHAVWWSGVLWLATQVRQTPLGIVAAVKRFNVLTIGTTMTQAAVVLVGLVALGAGGDFRDFVAAQACTALAATVVWYVVAARQIPGVAVRPGLDAPALRKTTRFGFWQMLNSLGSILAQQSQRWLLGIMLNVVTVGVYNIAVQLVNTLYMIAFRVGQVLFPEVSALEGAGRNEEAARLAVRSTWFVSLAASGLYVPVVIFAPDLLRLWVGADLASAATVAVRIVSIGAYVGCLFAVPSFYLLGTERGSWLAAMSIVNGCVVLAACLLLVPRFGVSGAATSFVVGTTVHLGVMLLLWNRILRAWIPVKEFLAASFGGLLVSLIVAGIGTAVRGSFQPGFGLLMTVALCIAAGIAAVGACVAADVNLPGGAVRVRTLRTAISTVVSIGRHRFMDRRG